MKKKEAVPPNLVPASEPHPKTVIASGLMPRLGAAGPVAIVLSFWPPLGGFVLLATLTHLGLGCELMTDLDS